MLSMRIVHAGEGYAYLMNSVATHDDTSAPEMSLGDYYNANGTPPGRWFGQGLKGLGETTAIAGDRKSTRLNSSHSHASRMPSSA